MLSNQTPGCSKSGLFKAFSEHVMSRLGIVQEKFLQVLLFDITLFCTGIYSMNDLSMIYY